MKYIVYKNEPGMELMQIFCEMVEDDHAERAARLNIPDDNIVSAGFFGFDKGEIVCWGHSNSLTEKLGRKIVSRGEKDVKVFMFHNRTALMFRG